MAQELTEIGKIELRIDSLSKWIDSNAPQCRKEQKHLDEGSQERAYWHFGYLTALRDVLRLLTGQGRPSRKSCKPDKPNFHSQA